MSAAATVAVAVIDTSVPVTLIISSVHLAAILSSICRLLVHRNGVSSSEVIFLIDKGAVVYLGGDSSWAEAISDKSMASLTPITGALSTALACTLLISFA